MPTVGESVIDTRTGRVVLIVEVHELWGMTTCKVIDMTSNNVYSVNAENLSASGTASAVSESFVRFVAAWCKVKNELANGTVFDTSESVLPLPHQRYALERAIATNEVRYMLADEVGLGKTIEDGIWSLWRIALSDGDEDQRMVSIFINGSGVYRPAASKLLWDEMLREKISLHMCGSEELDDETFGSILTSAAELTEDTFITMKNQYKSQHEQEFQKRRYALILRIEAASKIGIDNIRTYITHGSDSIEELLVPFVRIGEAQNG